MLKLLKCEYFLVSSLLHNSQLDTFGLWTFEEVILMFFSPFSDIL